MKIFDSERQARGARLHRAPEKNGTKNRAARGGGGRRDLKQNYSIKTDLKVHG